VSKQVFQKAGWIYIVFYLSIV